ncbi:hypothetical protein B296_00001042 [Ensete ventricosum]|uniref:Uncharacterized protein n=1 Tax=Ensete ventricosum TaxID=4639 RepID=A0A427B0V9_ENSVE|nr:hypothetical protein B296_00001042 [Ensete ventricosum]
MLSEFFVQRICNYFHPPLILQIYVPTNPRGAERLPPCIVVPESDFYLRRLWGNPDEVGILERFPLIGVIFSSHFRYIKLVKKHGLEISQPGLEPNNGLTWQMTKRRGDREVHK